MTALPSPPAQGAPFRVLIIEDDAVVARVASAALSGMGLECTHAADGATGLQMFSQMTPHLVLLDLMLPDSDGRALCQYMRQHSSIPIIMITALNDEETHLQGLKVGADDYLPKPFNPKIMAAHVVSHLRRAYRYAPVPAAPQQVAAPSPPQPAPQAAAEPAAESAPALQTGDWPTCEACGYMGPRQMFVKEDKDGVPFMRCPFCKSTEHITFSLG